MNLSKGQEQWSSYLFGNLFRRARSSTLLNYLFFPLLPTSGSRWEDPASTCVFGRRFNLYGIFAFDPREYMGAEVTAPVRALRAS